MPIKHQIIRKKLKRKARKFGPHNLRFVWTVGAIREVYPDIPEFAGKDGEDCVKLWDRQEGRPVLTFHYEYHQAFCLETTRQDGGPFTLVEKWLNRLSNQALESEGLVATV